MMADRTDQSDGQAMTDPTPLLSLRGIGKRYGAVVAVPGLAEAPGWEGAVRAVRDET